MSCLPAHMKLTTGGRLFFFHAKIVSLQVLCKMNVLLAGHCCVCLIQSTSHTSICLGGFRLGLGPDLVPCLSASVAQMTGSTRTDSRRDIVTRNSSDSIVVQTWIKMLGMVLGHHNHLLLVSSVLRVFVEPVTWLQWPRWSTVLVGWTYGWRGMDLNRKGNYLH